MNIKIANIVLAISVLLSSWLYWGTDVKIEQVLTSREWSSNMVFIKPKGSLETIPELEAIGKIQGLSTIKYLPNGSYIKVSTMSFFDFNNDMLMDMELSESGTWELSDNYLLVHPGEIMDTTPRNTRAAFSEEQLAIIKELYMLDAQESRRIDIINKNSILLSSLDHGSIILSSNQ